MSVLHLEDAVEFFETESAKKKKSKKAIFAPVLGELKTLTEKKNRIENISTEQKIRDKFARKPTIR